MRRATAAAAAASARCVDRAVAQRCSVLRIPRFLSDDDIRTVLSLRDRHRALHGPAEDARPGWTTTYVSAGGLFRTHAPALLERLCELPTLVDPSLFSDDGRDDGLAREVLSGVQVSAPGSKHLTQRT